MRIIDDNKLKSKQAGSDSDLIDGLRQLEASSGISYPILQKISKGNRNPQLSTVISIIESFGMKPSDFFKMFENVTDNDIKLFKKKLEQERASKKGHKQTPVAKKG